MWNLDYAIPSLMIFTVIIGHYITLPRLPIKKNRVFICLNIVSFLGIALDIVSTWADMNYQLFPSWALYLFNSGYFITFFGISFFFFIFTASALNSSLLTNKLGLFLASLPIDLGTLLVLTTPWTKLYYYMDETGYHSGPMYIWLYFIWAIYIIFSFYLIATYKRRTLRKREYEILIGCNIVLTVGIILRYIFPHYLLMLIFILIAFIVLFLGFQNPDTYLEERTFIFNRIALRDYIFELNEQSVIRALVICDKSYTDKLELYGIKQTNQGVYLVQNYLRKEFPNLLIFYYGNGRFVMFDKRHKTTDWNDVYKRLRARFMYPWISLDTEVFFDLGATSMTLDNGYRSFDMIRRVIDEAFYTAEANEDGILYEIDSSNLIKIEHDVNVKKALDKAIEKDEVEVFLQPIINSKTGKIAGAEALARIRDANGEIISPGEFIPIAEKSGKIIKLGRQVFKKCCEYVNNPSIKAINLSFINVNLSPIQFMRMDLVNTLNGYIDEAGIDREKIRLEITEEAMVDEQLMDKQITSLTGSGFKFVLDDYGKGYSNMSRLRKTPFINIKLDMTIVWDYCSNPDHILPSEVHAFKTSGFEVTAEGIENEDMAKKMTEIGCDYLQGYYYSKPLPLEEFINKYRPY